MPDGETLDQVAERADRVIARCRAAGGDCLLFAHGHLLRILAARWIEQPPVLGQRLALDPATLSVLAWEHEYPVIAHWNTASHLAELA